MMRLLSLKKWLLPLTLIIVLGISLGKRPVWGKPITRGEGNQSVMLQPLTESELAEIAGRNARVPLLELTPTIPPLRDIVLLTGSVLRQQGRIILDSDIVAQALPNIREKVSDTLGRIKVRFPAR